MVTPQSTTQLILLLQVRMPKLETQCQTTDITSWIQVLPSLLASLRPHSISGANINCEIYTVAFAGHGTMVSWCPTCHVDGGTMFTIALVFKQRPFSLPGPKPPTAAPAAPQPSRHQNPAAPLHLPPAKKRKLETASCTVRTTVPVHMAMVAT